MCWNMKWLINVDFLTYVCNTKQNGIACASHENHHTTYVLLARMSYGGFKLFLKRLR